MNKNISIYIHIPFCNSKCFYCNFTSYCNKDNLIEDYIDAVCKEILQNAEILSEYNIQTVYFGGGTPSYIDYNYIGKILDTLKLFQKSNDEFNEVTIEINPNSVTKEKLLAYKSYGINRLSIGLQSTFNNVLKDIGRTHTYEDFINALKYSKQVGITNISVDLIYPLPHLNFEMLNYSLDQILSLKDEYNIKHISVYNLELHEDTKLDFLLKNNFLKLVDEDEEYKMRNLIINKLSSNNYNHYEISNFAINGYESKHNLTYWNQKYYLGFGISAASFLLGSRYKNTENIEKYIKGINSFLNVIEEKEDMDQLDMMKEYVILKLRLEKGVSIKAFNKKFSRDIFSIFGVEINELIKKNLLLKKDDSIYLSSRGKEVANQVWEMFI